MILFPGCNRVHSGLCAWKGLRVRVGTVALLLALVQNPGTSCELGKLFPAAHSRAQSFSSACSLLGVTQFSGSTEPTICCCHPGSCICPLPPRVPRKPHDPVLGVDFTFSLIFSKWRNLSCHSFTEKFHPVLHSEIKLDRDPRAHSEFPSCFAMVQLWLYPVVPSGP